MEDEDYFDSLAHLRGQLQDLGVREAASAVRETRTETDNLAVGRDDSEQNLERRRTLVARSRSTARARAKEAPEIDSIEITPVGTERA
ncbi:hypothetical protein [Streptomyces sp. MOE7]|uniref:hypothetical protein n=1 Tax=Streptomyces sp. MOE7 TaxID=1961713 RepID=UPI000A074697|nr:hypothetical protein [Streptomyces sp. MOE7]ARH91910.1 hypothetical protein STRMOE7_18145 [Streptomyces sp. MOE7]